MAQPAAPATGSPTSPNSPTAAPIAAPASTPGGGLLVRVSPWEAPPASTPVPRPTRGWYGDETLLMDGSAALLAATSLGLSAIRDSKSASGMSVGVGALAATVFFMGPPILHWSQGNIGKGFASLGLRAGLPILGVALLVPSVGSGSSEDAPAPSLGEKVLAYSGLGVLAAWIPASIAIDAALLAYDSKPAPKVSLQPLVVPRQGGAVVGLGGSF